MRGRPRQPLKLKLLRGTHRPHRDGPAADAVEATGSPEMPRHLKGEARRLWRILAPLVSDLGAALADSTHLAAACEWLARYRRITARLDKCTTMPDMKRLSLCAKLCWREFDSIAARFGLTPSDRARLRIAPRPAAGDAFEDFLERRPNA